ncbi:MAG: tRNA pseudouridine(55) synthase TruB [Anaerolineae bacterium]|nr:tRNA pseudouridine(55) synthase TruB [Anaerolineae bacterium]
MSGFLNVHKPEGLTSHDVVARVRRHTGVRRVGHTGTLDPFAMGVLVLSLGKATRLSEFLLGSSKEYRAVVELGRSTDTYDRTGQVTAEHDPSGVRREDVEAALARFRGRILQVPPPFSAIKKEGVPLYRLARAGKQVQPEPREVQIQRLELVAWQPPRLTLEVTCSAGTYIRSLAHDLGQALGCGAHLAELVRLRTGRFRLEDAVPLEAVLEAEPAVWQAWLHPLEAAVEHLPRVDLRPGEAKRLAHGQPVRAGEDVPAQPGDLARAHGPGGELVALVRLDPATRSWRPYKVLAS